MRMQGHLARGLTLGAEACQAGCKGSALGILRTRPRTGPGNAQGQGLGDWAALGNFCAVQGTVCLPSLARRSAIRLRAYLLPSGFSNFYSDGGVLASQQRPG